MGSIQTAAARGAVPKNTTFFFSPILAFYDFRGTHKQCAFISYPIYVRSMSE